MPRNARRRLGVFAVALGLGGSCEFSAPYQSGQTTCNDGRCPGGLVCDAMHVCVTRGDDAGVDAADAGVDAHVAALTCGDPGELASGVAVMGTTAGRSNTVAASCEASILNGPDAIYAIAITAGQSLQISLAGSGSLDAYALASCELVPATPTCVGDMYAAGSPITASPGTAGTFYVVVDSVLANGSGAYTLTVTAD